MRREPEIENPWESEGVGFPFCEVMGSVWRDGAAGVRSRKSIYKIARRGTARGKVGNLGLVFHFSSRGPHPLWECGNLAGFARFPRGGGKSGKPAFGFPLFPRTRHFHSGGLIAVV